MVQAQCACTSQNQKIEDKTRPSTLYCDSSERISVSSLHLVVLLLFQYIFRCSIEYPSRKQTLPSASHASTTILSPP
jgi:hypothetical protein